MFIILVYDVNVKHVSKVRKIVERFLRPVQKSVFEGFVSDRALKKLQWEIENNIDCDMDSVLIYKQTFNGMLIKCQLGRKQDLEGSIL